MKLDEMPIVKLPELKPILRRYLEADGMSVTEFAAIVLAVADFTVPELMVILGRLTQRQKEPVH